MLTLASQCVTLTDLHSRRPPLLPPSPLTPSTSYRTCVHAHVHPRTRPITQYRVSGSSPSTDDTDDDLSFASFWSFLSRQPRAVWFYVLGVAGVLVLLVGPILILAAMTGLGIATAVTLGFTLTPILVASLLVCVSSLFFPFSGLLFASLGSLVGGVVKMTVFVSFLLASAGVGALALQRSSLGDILGSMMGAGDEGRRDRGEFNTRNTSTSFTSSPFSPGPTDTIDVEAEVVAVDVAPVRRRRQRKTKEFDIQQVDFDRGESVLDSIDVEVKKLVRENSAEEREFKKMSKAELRSFDSLLAAREKFLSQ